jgi:hypothetical protein
MKMEEILRRPIYKTFGHSPVVIKICLISMRQTNGGGKKKPWIYTCE